MADDSTDSDIVMAALQSERRRSFSLEILHNEMPCRKPHKQLGKRALLTLLNRLRLRHVASADISTPDPTHKVAYLGNVLTGWAKGEGCVEKPLATLWKNYTQSSRPDVRMQLTVSGGGLKANTKDHGLTEYWANRITFCAAPKHFPRLFCWVYRHEGRRLRHELRCHAVLCSSNSMARQIESQLRTSLSQALVEFKKDKISRQNARLSLVNSIYENPSLPRRKILLSTGSSNYRPPLERSKSAPKLTMIEENLREEEEGEDVEHNSDNLRKINSFTFNINSRLLKHCSSTSTLIEKREALYRKLAETSHLRLSSLSIPVMEEDEEEDDISDRRISFDPSELIDEAIDDRSNRILEEIVNETITSQLIDKETKLDLTWFRHEDITSELVPPDSDEGSLSSGCESASTITSENDQHTNVEEPRKPEIEFKVGGTVLARVKSLERLANCADVRKYCVLKHSNLRMTPEIPDADEVSLIPVGETQTDFSSLKVYKKRNVEVERDICAFDTVDVTDLGSGSEGENDSACSDESGYSELIDCHGNENDNPSPISKVVLV